MTAPTSPRGCARLERAVILALAAPAIAAATATACLGPDALRASAVDLLMLPTCLVAVLAYPVLLLLLVPTSLRRSLPFVTVVTITATAASFRLVGAPGLLLGWLAAIAAMLVALRWWRDPTVPSFTPGWWGTLLIVWATASTTVFGAGVIGAWALGPIHSHL